MTEPAPSRAPADPSVTPTVLVDLDAIAANVAVLRDSAGSAQVMAVVKADGYGHGAAAVARVALAAGAAELGVATVGEALALRADGVDAPLLAWLHPPGTDFGPALLAGIGLGVSSRRQLGEVLDAAERTGQTAAVTVKADTGLNRSGVPAEDFDALIDDLGRAAAAGAVRVDGLMSHLACADEPGHPANDAQAGLLADLRAAAERRGVRFRVAHLANSAATLTRPDLAFDVVRPGIAVYGLNPVPRYSDAPLTPAMTLSAPVTMVKRVRAGAGVSYGHTWTAERDTTVALIPLGYADGVFRALSGRLQVAINGRRYPNVGRICMDQFVVDLGPGTVDVTEGDAALLFGPGSAGEATATDVAELIDTIDYEVVTSPRGRVTRRYRGGAR
ncbi:alanine racemase [Mycolicibacterium fallax]|uniref:Alanine racemase n=1 Tax=Mycolicibacterium fallax TaxID=1793 RepID=A0A1X1RLJ1_MYCFA|nr:alanine racemase [Mycolicibacterium fallax]ORV09138.1 alanine racemase [Mycolicibacterium fallax]HOW93524.1 alanine racemase [Mycolicibacterium fallax]HSA40078.1 alanine racemase [Mycobacterium sp.]